MLRKQRGITQQQLADEIGSNRPVIGAYEEGRAEPGIQMLHRMAKFFAVSLDKLLGIEKEKNPVSALRILPIMVSKDDNRERISLVPLKASAGYLTGYQDAGFIEKLPVFDLPLTELKKEATYRMFQIEGDSMLPIPSGSYIIGSFVENWKTLKSGASYVFITLNDGIVYKRATNNLKSKGVITMQSDNQIFKEYDVPQEEIKEVWKALGYLSFELPSN